MINQSSSKDQDQYYHYKSDSPRRSRSKPRLPSIQDNIFQEESLRAKFRKDQILSITQNVKVLTLRSLTIVDQSSKLLYAVHYFDITCLKYFN